jgi:hypothetical protein
MSVQRTFPIKFACNLYKQHVLVSSVTALKHHVNIKSIKQCPFLLLNSATLHGFSQCLFIKWNYRFKLHVFVSGIFK